MTDIGDADKPLNAIHLKLLRMWGWKYTPDGVEAWLMKTQDYDHLVKMLEDAEAFMNEKCKLCKAKTPFDLKYPEDALRKSGSRGAT
jgi:hypothetical protein